MKYLPSPLELISGIYSGWWERVVIGDLLLLIQVTEKSPQKSMIYFLIQVTTFKDFE